MHLSLTSSFLKARVDNYWAPLTYSILPNEDQETLRTAFSQVRAAVEANGSTFSKGCEVMFDYDGHLRDMYKEVIGRDFSHTFRGCTFHFSQCIINYVNGDGMMSAYRNPENVILRDTVHAALGLSYMREEDLEYVQDDLHTIFENTQESDPKTFNFLVKFVDKYIAEYWLTHWEKSEICFWGDLSYFSSEHMTNNALESHNNEVYHLLGRKAHPNPYFFMCAMKKSLRATERNLKLVDRGDFEEVRSSKAIRAIKSSISRENKSLHWNGRFKKSKDKVHERDRSNKQKNSC